MDLQIGLAVTPTSGTSSFITISLSKGGYMKNDFSLNMGSKMDAIFNQMFSAPNSSFQNAPAAGGTNARRKKKDIIRLTVRSKTGGTNLVTIAKDTPVFTPKQVSDLAIGEHGHLDIFIIDYGTHRTLNTKNIQHESPLEREIIQ
nr:hypothetical protein [Providencia rettgeri]